MIIFNFLLENQTQSGSKNEIVGHNINYLTHLKVVGQGGESSNITFLLNKRKF